MRVLRQGSCPRDSCPRGSCPRGSCPRGSCPRGSCPWGCCPVPLQVLSKSTYCRLNIDMFGGFPSWGGLFVYPTHGEVCPDLGRSWESVHPPPPPNRQGLCPPGGDRGEGGGRSGGGSGSGVEGRGQGIRDIVETYDTSWISPQYFWCPLPSPSESRRQGGPLTFCLHPARHISTPPPINTGSYLISHTFLLPSRPWQAARRRQCRFLWPSTSDIPTVQGPGTTLIWWMSK